MAFVVPRQTPTALPPVYTPSFGCPKIEASCERTGNTVLHGVTQGIYTYENSVKWPP